MKKTGKLLSALAASTAFAAALAGCNTTGCTDNRSSIPLAGFYSASDETSVSIDSLEIGGIGAPNDSLIINIDDISNQVYLPLRSTASTASYFITYRQKSLEQLGISDTVTIDYTSIPFFASEECGAMYRYRINSLSHTSILLDSVAITAADSLITNANIETLRFFFLVSTSNDSD